MMMNFSYFVALI